jgi:spermidine synthase
VTPPAPRSAPGAGGRARLGALALLGFLSGASLLGVETVWQRWFRVLLGATAPAAAAALLALMLGQAAGALLASRALRGARRPLVLFGALELAAAAAAVWVPPALSLAESLLFASAYDSLRESPAALLLLRFASALGATLPAALAWGATFPALAAAARPQARGLVDDGTLLYGANLAGGGCGALFAALWLPERIGIPATYAVAVALSALAGAGALALAARRLEPAAPTSEAPAPPPRPARGPQLAPLGPRPLTALAVLSGAGSFAFQVLLVYAFALVLNQSIAVFGMVLATVLGALALGALAVTALGRISALEPRAALSLALGAAGLACAAFPGLLVRRSSGLAFLGSEAPWPGYLWESLGLVVGCAGLPLLCVGLVFPLVLAAAGRAQPSAPAGRVAGLLLAANTLGAAAGALAVPFALLPALGPWLPCVALGTLYLVAALAIRLPDPRWRLRRDLLFGVGWIAVIAPTRPLSLPLVAAPRESILAVDPTPAGVVATLLRDGERLIQIDNHYALGGTAERVHQERQGHLPLVLHGGARRVAHLGSATAISAGASLAHPVERLLLVELVPGVSGMARRFFRDANRGVYEDPRAQPVLDDARSFLRQTRERFDVLVADLFVPWQAGTASLYTREHFEAARAHLAPGGLFCQWLPLYQLSPAEFAIVAATFLDVFPQARVLRGDFYGDFPIVALLGGALPDPARVAPAARALAARGERDRWVADPAGVWALYVGPLEALGHGLHDAPRQSDAHPVLEYRAARGHAGGGSGKRDAFVGVAWARAAAGGLRAGEARADPLLAALPPEERRAVGGGAALQLAGALYAEGQLEESGRALALAAELLPPRLFADAPADPTAAQVWHGEE